MASVGDWGPAHWFGTPAYWLEQCTLRAPATFRLGDNLIEEIAACLLGGYGIPAEVGLAAFNVLRGSGLLRSRRPPSEAQVLGAISGPIRVGKRFVRYRFVHQRSQRLAACLAILAENTLPAEPLALREALRNLPGIGLKTASWIVRNYTGSDYVAIIDVHVQRACTAAGLFDTAWQLPRDYLECEEAFLSFAKSGGVSAAALDACIWEQMHELGSSAPQIAANVRTARESGWNREAWSQSQHRLDPDVAWIAKRVGVGR